MSTIVPPPADEQAATTYFTCPNCAEPAKSTSTRAETPLTVITGCLCLRGHVWTVHWMVNV